MQLEVFNSVDRADAIDVLRPCLDIQRWMEHIADARPFSSLDSLLDFARQTAGPFTSDEVAAAMAHHPRIGERPKARTTEAGMSRSEQAGVDPSDDGIVTALAKGNREYEAKFGRVFLIRAAGRTAEELLSSLQERLTHSAEEEDVIVAGQLREIALLRLAGVISEAGVSSEANVSSEGVTNK